ncbi:uncharacterized protein F5147DRAFT_657314 [Suillus discolor]|uniref:Uncharacterized protein n=1 Tax=Suillus discolor TaxID=1912936 RepID=A0A9P7EXF1_9AGAM|nr:uncharacterized protein F5147DRAFT_657314 [Suillus discolor]KAG2093904.1 hypothetical protein F5147DRAFT_657314 [Suillus discolor]
MSSNISPAAATTANQALIALLGRLNEMVEEVLRSRSEDERMRLSRVIASQMNDAIHSYRTTATYISLRLLSMAAEIHRAQRGATRLVQVPDWTRVGNNEDICRGHPLYPKTLGPPPTHTTPTSAPALPSGPPPAPVLPAPSTIRIPGNATSGAIAGPSKPCKRQFSASPPHQVKRAQKAIPKSKPLLTDTDTDGDTVHISKDKPKAKGKGKAKAKARAASPDSEIRQMTMEDGDHDQEVILRNPKPNVVKKNLPTIVITTRPKPPPDEKKKATDSEEYEPEEEEEEDEDDAIAPSGTRSKSGTDHTKTAKDKAKTRGKRPQPSSKLSVPVLFLEEPDVDVDMPDAPALTGTGHPGTATDATPEPQDDTTLPPAPFIETPDDIRYSPVYPSHTRRPASPVDISVPRQTPQPRSLTNVEMDALLAQIQIDMDQLRTRDDIIHDELSHRIDQLQASFTNEFASQKGVVDQLTFQQPGSTPPAFNPPPIVIPDTPTFPDFGSISALGHAITNNVFTPDVFSTNTCPVGDGSPVTRHEQVPTPSTSTINPVPTMGESGPHSHPVSALPVPAPTVTMASMPSNTTLRTMLTGPPHLLEDGQSLSAPLPTWSFAPQSRQQGRSLPDHRPVRLLMHLPDDNMTGSPVYIIRLARSFPFYTGFAIRVIPPIRMLRVHKFTQPTHMVGPSIYLGYTHPAGPLVSNPIRVSWVHTFTRPTHISWYNYVHGPTWDGLFPTVHCHTRLSI